VLKEFVGRPQRANWSARGDLDRSSWPHQAGRCRSSNAARALLQDPCPANDALHGQLLFSLAKCDATALKPFSEEVLKLAG